MYVWAWMIHKLPLNKPFPCTDGVAMNRNWKFWDLFAHSRTIREVEIEHYWLSFYVVHGYHVRKHGFWDQYLVASGNMKA
jgi:hypothetical protein